MVEQRNLLLKDVASRVQEIPLEINQQQVSAAELTVRLYLHYRGQ